MSAIEAEMSDYDPFFLTALKSGKRRRCGVYSPNDERRDTNHEARCCPDRRGT